MVYVIYLNISFFKKNRSTLNTISNEHKEIDKYVHTEHTGKYPRKTSINIYKSHPSCNSLGEFM